MDRRTLLRRTVGVSAGVVAAGSLATMAHIWVVRGTDAKGLTPYGKDILRHMSRGVLASFLAANAAKRELVLNLAMHRIASGAAGLPRLVKLQLGGLLGAVDSPATQYMLTGVSQSWNQLTDAQVSDALDRMRLSTDMPTLLAYKALRSLVCLQVFSDRQLQALLTAYPSPMSI